MQDGTTVKNGLETKVDKAKSNSDKKTGTQELTDLDKAALVLIAVGEKKAAEIMKHLTDDELEKLTIAIAKMTNIQADDIGLAIEEFYQSVQAKDFITKGGMGYAKEVLEKAWGHKKAEQILQKVEAATEVSAFYLLQTVDDKQLINFLQSEHPQTAALILANLKPNKAATILSELPEDQQTEISYRLATMEKTSPELIREIESALRDQMGTVFGQEVSKMGGTEAVAQILNSASRSAEKNVLTHIKNRNPKLADEIKNHMFLFEDIEDLSNSAVQMITKELDSQSLALALKGATPGLKDKFMNNMSERAAEMLKDELQYLGPVRVREVENAQKKVIDIVRELEESGEISMTKEEDEIIE